ncbi:MAG TPA: glycosyltransferase family 4 protein [Azospirillaceae bacterium]|nr:glycosyltransferase family 4 protein [Azospirillaceae bacterium]
MRILHCILSRGFRGAERHVAELASAQAARGHAVTLVVRRDCAEEGRSILPHVGPGVTVRKLGPWLRRWRLRRLLREAAPDIVHTHGGRAGRALGAIRTGAPTLATLHLDYRPKWYRGHDALIAQADWQRDAALAGGFKGMVARVNAWSHPHPPPDAATVARLRVEMGAGPGERLVLAVGQLIPEKGMDLLVRAVRALPDPRLRLAVAGHGAGRAGLEALAAGDRRIRLLGFRDDVRDLYFAADLFCSPSRFEPFGLVFLEALDAGLPVVASTSEGAKAILTSLPNTRLVPPSEEPGPLAEALAAMLDAPRHRQDMSPWSPEACFDGIEAVYRELLSRRATPA